MTRSDAWIMDPFGGALGRWGGAASGGTPAAWYAPIVAILTSGGATGYLWLHEVGIPNAVGQPVEAWEDTTGALAWVQAGASSLRPLRAATEITFDGIDDRMNGEAGISSVLSGATWTMAAGARTNTASGTRFYWTITDGSVSNIMGLTAVHRLSFVPAATLFASATSAGPLSVWVTRAGDDFTRRLSAVESLGTNATYPVTLNLPTLGARRTTSTGLFFQGSLAWVALTTRTLSSADMLAIETILAANGYPT